MFFYKIISFLSTYNVILAFLSGNRKFMQIINKYETFLSEAGNATITVCYNI